jgi:hypothetical protein
MRSTRLKFRVATIATGMAGALMVLALGLLSPLATRGGKRIDQRIEGVPGCTASSHRTVIVPAGAKVAFSCPTHIEIVSMDERTPTIITIQKPSH